MKRRTLVAGFLALCLMSSAIPAFALGHTFDRTLTLGGPGAGNFVISDLGMGDKVNLTLVNPTSQPLVFETTQNLGNEKSWVVPPNSSISMGFEYTRPFDDDVEFSVHNVGTNMPVISQGILIPRGTPAATLPQDSNVQVPTSQDMTRPQRTQAVRGFW